MQKLYEVVPSPNRNEVESCADGLSSHKEPLATARQSPTRDPKKLCLTFFVANFTKNFFTWCHIPEIFNNRKKLILDVVPREGMEERLLLIYDIKAT